MDSSIISIQEEAWKGVQLYTGEMNLSGNPDMLDIDALEKALVDLIKKFKKNNDLTGLRGLYNRFDRKDNPESFEMKSFVLDSFDFYKLSPFSRKKVVAYHLKKKYPDKEKRKKLLRDLKSISDYMGEEELCLVKQDPLFIKAQQAFLSDYKYNFEDILSNFEYQMTPEYQKIYLDLLREGKVSENIINKFEEVLSNGSSSDVIKIGADIQGKYTEADNMRKILTTTRQGAGDINPMTLAIDFDLGVKLYGLDRLKEIYKTLFYKTSRDILLSGGGKEPIFNQLMLLDIKKLKVEAENKKNENKIIPQFLVEWEIEDELSSSEMVKIVELLKSEGYNINLTPSVGNKNLSYPRTIDGVLTYKGHFDESGSDLEGSSIILIENKKSGEKRLRLSLDNFNQDSYVYLIAQIGLFLEAREFTNKNQLYFNIYDKYNKEIYGSNELYDISIFEKQYSEFMEKLIIPHSTEGFEFNLPKDNVLLAGIYGSGKSQFLLKLLREKEFLYKEKTFHLNANVIYIDLQFFKGMLKNTVGGFRTVLDEKFQKTGVPIILVVEDIDTLINEQLTGGNDEIAQAMTLLFEGVGSTPVTVVATANDPSKFSERLVRPNRMNEIIVFELPTLKEKIAILEQHARKRNIDFTEEVLNSLSGTQLFKTGTASHIGKFVKKLSSQVEIMHLVGDTEFELSDDEILRIANSINVSAADIEDTIKGISEWVLKVTGRECSNGIGFNADVK